MADKLKRQLNNLANFLREKQPKQECIPVCESILRCDSYSFRLLASLNELRKADMLCDYILVADGRQIKVHRTVMMACSDYFRAMFSVGMRDSDEDTVELPGLTYTGLIAMVNFAYDGSLELTVDNLEELLHAATYLQIPEAIRLCCKFMDMAITVENCVDMSNIAEQYAVTMMQKQSQMFILTNLEDLCASDEYLKLTKKPLGAVLADNSLKVTSEYRLFELILKWINHNLEARRQYTSSLMSYVRFPLMSSGDLEDKVSSVGLMRQTKECQDLLEEAERYQTRLMDQPFLQNSRTQVRSGKRTLISVGLNDSHIKSHDLDIGSDALQKDALSLEDVQGPALCVVNNFLFVCGGLNVVADGYHISAKCFRYDPRNNSWLELAPMKEARSMFSLVAHNNLLFAIGGNGLDLALDSVEAFSVAKNEWEFRKSVGPRAVDHGAASCQDRLYISGGKRNGVCTDSVMSYDVTSNLWRDEPPLLKERMHHAMVELSGKLYVLGGQTEREEFTTTIETFCLSTNLWTVCKHDFVTFSTDYAGVCVLDDSLYVFGFDPQEDDDYCACTYDPSINEVTWREELECITTAGGRECCILNVAENL